MASCFVVPRRVASGRVSRYVVRFRVGGRESELRHAGSFKTLREARLRQAWVLGELAAMRVPDLTPPRPAEPAPVVTLRAAAERYVAARVDLSAASLKNVESHLLRLLPALGERDVAGLTPDDVQSWVAANGDLAPASIKRYVATLRQIIDHAGVEPNVARDRRVRLPTAKREEIEPPSAAHVAAIIECIPAKWKIPVRLIEATGLRVGELAQLRWGDLDARASRFRVRQGKTPAARRWVQLPADLLAEIEALLPMEDRTPERRIFPISGDDLRQAMSRACRFAGIPVYSPHDLRHRAISRWHRAGVPIREIAHRVGHARSSLTLDVYSHVLLDD